MDTFRKIIPICLGALFLLTSCTIEEEPIALSAVDSPGVSALIYPVNNTECNEGIVVSETETDVLFKWEKTTNTSSYLLVINDLNAGTSREIKTISNEFLIRILRGTPYSWHVKSIGSDTKTSQSTVWKFYNAGLPKLNHPPFPAEAVSPKIGSTIAQGTVKLEWHTTDIDNDIVSYKVYTGTNNVTSVLSGTTTINSFDVNVTLGLIYYWKIVTTDAAGNSSDSQIFQFKVD
jgi:hypothetical protein